MEYTWSEEGTRAKRESRAFAESLGLSRTSRFDRSIWQRIAEAGLLGAYVPAEYGGDARSFLETVHQLIGFGSGCLDNGLSLSVNSQMWAVQEPILRFGTEEQKQSVLRGLVNGSLIGALAMTERDTGSDAFSLSTTATPVDGGYVLNGEKVYIGLGPVCDVALVFATVNPDLGQWGVTAFLVDASTPGFVAGAAEPTMGLGGSPLGTVSFDDCLVPEEHRLGPAGAGVSIFNHLVEWERSFIFASHVGAMERQLEDCIAYAKERRQFGQPIGRFQSVSNRIADMRLRLDTCQLMIYRVAMMKDEGASCAVEAALAKVQLSEAFVASSLDAIRIHGATGYLSEFGIEPDLRDAVGGLTYSGTNDVQKQLVARLLGL
ncbi:MAG: acyl-CoA dehydrogenase family protein [Pseudomonadota bacterium]